MKRLIVWFRRDLRLSDHPAFYHACQAGQVIPVYIHSPEDDNPWQPGAASQWWLHHSLKALEAELKKLGSPLYILEGDTEEILLRIVRESGIDAVYCQRLYEPASMKRDKRIKQRLQKMDVKYQSFSGRLMFEPWQIKTGNDTPYKVYTPFWRACSKRGLPCDLIPRPRKLAAGRLKCRNNSIASLGLLPGIRWDSAFPNHWQPGEQGAQQCLREFVKTRLQCYKKDRDFPHIDGTSHLSPHLHFGEISPRQIVYRLEQVGDNQQMSNTAIETFLKELTWREFTHHVLYHFPQTLRQPLNERFRDFPWQNRETKLVKSWQLGLTGYPIIDAGMRELWSTGTMHNRVRMIVGSFLTKNANIHWLQGAKWFWDTLVDADLAQNTFNWQWIAGCGADAAPYFRIFNPVTQSEKFDRDGLYLRKWVPELRNLPSRFIHKPWTADPETQREAECVIGEDYPEPVLDLKTTREAALQRYKEWNNKNR